MTDIFQGRKHLCSCCFAETYISKNGVCPKCRPKVDAAWDILLKNFYPVTSKNNGTKT